MGCDGLLGATGCKSGGVGLTTGAGGGVGAGAGGEGAGVVHAASHTAKLAAIRLLSLYMTLRGVVGCFIRKMPPRSLGLFCHCTVWFE